MSDMNRYSNLLAMVPVTILAGETQSEIINCAQLANGSGAGALRALKVFSGFPIANLSFFSLDSLDDTTAALMNVFDGVNKIVISIPTKGGLEKIGLPVIPFDAETYFYIVTDEVSGTDQIINLYFQPIYQGAA